MEGLLSQVVEELCTAHACHTVILYGSRARGDHSPESDVDVLGIRDEGGTLHDARPWNGVFLDAFVYPESILDTLDEGMLRIQGGRILLQRGNLGTRLLERVEAMAATSPPPPDPTEVNVRLAWATKMLARIGHRDPEGNYRRHWLLVQLLEDYFYLRGLRFEGSKRAFQWMKTEDPTSYRLFEAALEPGAPDDALQALVAHMPHLPVAAPKPPNEGYFRR